MMDGVNFCDFKLVSDTVRHVFGDFVDGRREKYPFGATH